MAMKTFSKYVDEEKFKSVLDKARKNTKSGFLDLPDFVFLLESNNSSSCPFNDYHDC